MSKIHIFGDVVTDISLPQNHNKIKMRLGGVTHCVRASWAMNNNFDVYFFSPQYLDSSIIDYFSHHGAIETRKIGNVLGAPYLFLIGEVKETGNQLYDFILRDDIEIIYELEDIRLQSTDDEVLIISGNFCLKKIMSIISPSANVHIDVSNNIKDIEELKKFKFKTIFLSTSSCLFKDYFTDSFIDFCNLFKDMCDILILKENRGGSRIFDFINKEQYSIPSQTQPVEHSVGVGDAYDACFISKYKEVGIYKAGILSSWVASEYASTTFVDDFKIKVTSILKSDIENLITLGGCSLNWEDRPKYHIYIAAPDFDYLDTSKIQLLVEALEYHNFTPRLPIKENGQISLTDNKDFRQKVFQKDIDIIMECSLLIAVYINDDPGTMIELGYAKSLGKPCLVYDPYSKAYNCMLTELPDLVSPDLDEIVSETFNKISAINAKK